ncbi:MAG: glycosyltransferase family 4 protein [Candidatus Methanoperedens sp.]|nr:glycosyltransferase family 4 protein [Candidatus Methanoperedens sp.]
MKINIFVEDLLFFKYIGCSTAAKTLYRELSKMPGMDISWNSNRYDFDVVHYHSFGPLSLLNRKYSRGIKILTAHSTPRVNKGNLAFSSTINQYYPGLYRRFDHIINISAPCQREIDEMLPEMSSTLIPNGIDREYFKPDADKRETFRERFNIDDDEKVVLTVAQQTPRKGIYDFLELSKKHPEIKWVWVGGFPYGIFSADYFQIKKMKKKCKNNVIFTGFVPDITEAYSGADVFFMPSYAETFGLVVLEALACGLPVVARNIPEFMEIFDDGVHFFGDFDEASTVINDDDSLRKSSEAARPFTEKFDIKHIARMHCDLYRRLIE